MLRLSVCLFVSFFSSVAIAAEAEFSQYEIRVIRPRYFVKAGRVELAAGAGAIVNQTFIYSFLATGLATWHFTETWALEAQAGYAASSDRDDKTALDASFDIQTVVLRPFSLANARVAWTPSYGKFHLTSSDVVYFDTHVTLGAGMTGVRYLYEHCRNPSLPKPPSKDVQYPTYVLGLGQRYFLSKRSSLRVGFELQRFIADPADSACGEGAAAPTAKAANDDLLLFTAWSYYL